MAWHDFVVSSEPNKVVEFDEVVTSSDDDPTVISSANDLRDSDTGAGQSSAFGGRFGQVWSTGRKAPWWLWPLLFVGLVVFLVLGLLVLIFIGIPLAILRMILPKKAG